MKYNIKNVIEYLQKFQKENPDETLINEDELLSLFRAKHKVNSINAIIENLEYIVDNSKLNNMNVSEAAMRIGVQRPTIYKWIKDGIIDSYKWTGQTKETVISLKELKENLEKIKTAKLDTKKQR